MDDRGGCRLTLPPGVRRRSLLLAAPAALVAGAGAGCSSAPAVAPPSASGWQDVPLPGKKATLYRWEDKGGRRALAAHAQASASMWRHKFIEPPQPLGEVAFSWWVDALIDDARLDQADQADAPVRVLYGFDGDRTRLSARNRMLFDLAEALTGEPPPFATLMYVWDNRAPVESVVHSARTDRIRKLVLDSGPSQLGRWRDHRRHLVQDFRLAFGEAPGALKSVAVMTDADNTGASARGWYELPRFV